MIIPNLKNEDRMIFNGAEVDKVVDKNGNTIFEVPAVSNPYAYSGGKSRVKVDQDYLIKDSDGNWKYEKDNSYFAVLVSNYSEAYANIDKAVMLNGVMLTKYNHNGTDLWSAVENGVTYYLGKGMDVWFTNPQYAIEAVAFSNGCYIKADGRRVYDNEDWKEELVSTSTGTVTLHQEHCNSCSGWRVQPVKYYNYIYKW